MSCGFSLEHYRELLRATRDGGYRFAGFDREPEAGVVILRHDVDLSLAGALIVAEAEADEGVSSTYCLMTRSVFYNLASAEGERAIARLRELGHRVGHHAMWPHADLDERFDPVVAWHNPEPEFMQAGVPGAVNVMSAPFFDPEHYRSDSNQHWRHGCPHEDLREHRFEWLQLLTHPEIWAFEGTTMRETMESMLDADRAARLEHLRHDRIDLS